jgi:hypothetical protein
MHEYQGQGSMQNMKAYISKIHIGLFHLSVSILQLYSAVNMGSSGCSSDPVNVLTIRSADYLCILYVSHHKQQSKSYSCPCNNEQFTQ